MTDKKTKPRFETQCVHTGVKMDTAYNSVTSPIYPSSTFAFIEPGKTAGFDYTRSGNPTRSGLEENLAALEGGCLARATSTGMSAIATSLFLFEAGDHIIAGHDIYGGTYRLFASVAPRMGLKFSFVDMREPAIVRNAISDKTRAIWIETPSNPLLNLVDIAAMVEIARERNLLTFCDNTFCSPALQRPLELGCDVAVHSTTKYINGHSDVVGGALIAREPAIGERIAFLVNALGTACSPFDAFLVLRGVKTLPLRMKAHVENARAVAEFLATHPNVERVYFPGLPDHPQRELAERQMAGPGGMVSFDIKGGAKAAERFVMRLRYFTLAESLGGVESLVEIPSTMSHASMDETARLGAGITPSNIRLSIGIEAASDLVDDLAQALEDH
ncbi:PLP-dependent aspartate aminotransferase family protein [bacterium]|nr:PLP-dependent aspartate aminotransferase family protein [bacterium]